MMSTKLNVYVAGGWFSNNQDEVLTRVETLLRDNPRLNAYLPRHDGVKLAENEFHNPQLREGIFKDNVKHIEYANLVVACCDGRDGFYDTGTQWEIGYAVSRGIPVIAYDTTENINTVMSSISRGFYSICHSLEDLNIEINNYIDAYQADAPQVLNNFPKKILFVGPDTTKEQDENNADIVSTVVFECYGSNFRWLDDLTTVNIYDNINDVFADIDCMIAVIDDRHPVVSWMMGQAYGRNIPTITYTNFDFGINIMLLCSIVSHCKGKEELKDLLQKIKREGIDSLPKFDNSTMKAM